MIRNRFSGAGGALRRSKSFRRRSRAIANTVAGQLFGALLTETILFPVPHRHFTLGIPKMLRPYFQFNRDLLKEFCRLAHECLVEWMRTTLSLPDAHPGIVMAIHTFGEYLWEIRGHILGDTERDTGSHLDKLQMLTGSVGRWY